MTSTLALFSDGSKALLVGKGIFGYFHVVYSAWGCASLDPKLNAATGVALVLHVGISKGV